MLTEALEKTNGSLSLKPRPALTLVGTPRVLPLDQYECFIGVSTNIAGLKQFISVQAAQHQPTLLISERGLRQEQVARVLHQASENWAQPFFAVNAHSLDSEALHSLLFGHRGMIETCGSGTIYVNELTRLPALLQQRFAAYIEEQRWRGHSGRNHGQKSGPRLIFATEWNPSEMRAENRIAYGLVDLLKQTSFTIKPLRERSEDIPYLTHHLLNRINKRLNKGPHEITTAAMKMLSDYSWEGNIDELEAALESAINSTKPLQIDESLLPTRVRYAALKAIPTAGIDLPQMVDDFERNLIETALRQTNNNQTKASALLGLRVQTLNMKLKRFKEKDGVFDVEPEEQE
ncbi:MAG TPA: sigma 54-interacting transcriptional regulator [Blastocatellia bacterium]|nr:sigma 54-interacting transcriptional regulator [Blastocatellia bacterium]HMV85287.1 sigma 54-interacting transcriptional regulator [Blastocatellia bacterium]HMX26379.1 sigma 54-interacting transcriptional regulator [Blastocatellia bacterium]HMY71216.1 sigma 54-interacting transcriptional regulator [Blastocatellia bacterium]HMZ17657.1 sigma 54-interacting transcriptional regulator [Blastocatellia bacterium]